MRSDKSDPMNPSFPAQSPYTRTRALMAQLTAILFLAGVLASGCVIHDHGGGHGQKYGHHKNSVKAKPHVVVTAPAPVTFVFTDHHRHTVRDYYHHQPRHHGKIGICL